MKKLFNRIEFYFVKAFNATELRSELLAMEYLVSGMGSKELDKAIKKFGKTKVFYPDNEVRTFGMLSWLELGEDILKLNNIKIKRCGRN